MDQTERVRAGIGLTLALTFYPLPQERKWPQSISRFAADHPANPAARMFKETANDSPSPWGEGRDEGGSNHKLPCRDE